MSGMNTQDYDLLIRRLKVLSKSQTAFLKAFVFEKLRTGDTLIRKTIELLDQHGHHHKSELQELYKQLSALKLHELDVDVNSTKLMMSQELETLRSHVHGHAHVNSTSTTGESSNEEIVQLRRENSELRELLEQAKSELKKNPKKATPSESTESNHNTEQTSKLSSENASLRSNIDTLNLRLTALQAENASLTAGSSNETKRFVEENSRLNQQLLKLTKDSELALRAKDETHNKLLEEKIAEMEAKFAEEREEIEDGCTQLVEEAEASKKEMEDDLNGKIQDLSNRLKATQTQLSHAQSSTTGLISQITSLKAIVQRLVMGYRELKARTATDLNEMKATLQGSFGGSVLRKLTAVDEETKFANARYRKEMAERKKLHNLIQELKGNIRVYLRCRPPSHREVEQFGEEATCVTFPEEGQVKVINEKSREKVWDFDEVFGFDATQSSIYQEVSGLVTSVLDGYNVCIFAYGQTGSGKTFTMNGPPDNRGVNTRALQELFTLSQGRADAGWVDTVSVSILQVYNEEIHDLLVESHLQEKLEVRQGEKGNYVAGLTCQQVTSLDDVVSLLAQADRNRSTVSTNMNEQSSRSHMMLQIIVESENRNTGMATRGKLNLVDLAGSERINKSGATGQALKEAQSINTSLSALGDVIAARASKAAHVPFRNSKLTFLLQDSLSQDSKTLMILCISPMLFNSEETCCSLNFAARVRSVELGKASKNSGTLGGGGGGGSSNSSVSSAKSTTSTSSTARKPIAR